MTTRPGSRGIVIEGVTLAGDVVTSFVLDHGDDPSERLHAAGWAVTGVVHAFTPDAESGAVIRVAVVHDLPDAQDLPVVHDHSWADGHIVTTRVPTTDNQVVPDGVEVRVHQRLAAYAVVVRDGLALLTQLSDQVRSGRGLWSLPGGGVDRGEDPAVGLRREVWEETGQLLGEIHLADLLVSHWVGQAPNGGWEDYHVIRLIYVATVPTPTELIVHDVGGTTAAAAWINLADLPDDQRSAVLIGDRWDQWVSLADAPTSRRRRGHTRQSRSR